MMDISIPYYEDMSRISNSNIGWFLNKGPAYLHKMLTDPPPEEKNPVLERGTMIHEYLLQPEEFQKDYVVWDKSRPSSTQQEKFCQELAKSLEIEPNKAILSAYKTAYRTNGKSDDKMLSEGLKIASELSEYISFLKADDGRKMISIWDYQMLEKIKKNIEEHKLAKQLVYPFPPMRYKDASVHHYDGDHNHLHDYYHEFHINWEYNNVQCKSLLDSVTFDFKNKVCTIVDLKTTQKLWHFEESMNTYDYCRQLCYYFRAVRWYLEVERKVDPISIMREWKFEFYIIGIDTTGSNEIRVFKLNEKQVFSRDHDIIVALGDIAWHQQNDKWDHSRAYYEGDGSETLNL